MLYKSEIVARNNINIVGKGEQTLLLAHGFGCDQAMWRFLVPFLSDKYRLVLFDYVGSGQSEKSAYDAQKYSSLEGYAQDIVDICETLELEKVSVVAHSVSCIIATIAAQQRPGYISNIIMVCPSPCFLNLPPDYLGGFEEQDLHELIALMDKNRIGWANYLAPLIAGTANLEMFTQELATSFCSTDPMVAKNFAKATFFSDYRHLLPHISQPVSIIQSQTDALASLSIGEFMHKNIPRSKISIIEAEGHCLHMTHPLHVANKIEEFLGEE
ncbi:MAG: sigma-B regulation protein RsbQ [Paraglaciecola sp.]|jgi:sigma-B regulation protein RsbQ